MMPLIIFKIKNVPMNFFWEKICYNMRLVNNS